MTDTGTLSRAGLCLFIPLGSLLTCSLVHDLPITRTSDVAVRGLTGEPAARPRASRAPEGVGQLSAFHPVHERQPGRQREDAGVGGLYHWGGAAAEDVEGAPDRGLTDVGWMGHIQGQTS